MRLPKKIIEVPFNADGDMMEFAASYHKFVTWKDNFEFDDELVFSNSLYATAGTKFVFKSARTGNTYYMFPTEVEICVPLMEKGVLEGRFTFVKRSTYFGIKLVVD